ADGSEDRERQLELRFHLLPPLPRQRRGREDQGPADEAPDRVLLQEEPRLDRLAETHLVRKDRTASHLPQDAQARPLLVRIPADGEGHRGGIPSPATAGGAKTHATLIIVAARRVQMHASSANA